MKFKGEYKVFADLEGIKNKYPQRIGFMTKDQIKFPFNPWEMEIKNDIVEFFKSKDVHFEEIVVGKITYIVKELNPSNFKGVIRK